MSIATKVEWVKLKHLRSGERVVLDECNIRAPETRVTVAYFDDPDEKTFGTIHRSHCLAPGVPPPILSARTTARTLGPCSCVEPFGTGSTIRLERNLGSRPVLWRFVPRPLTFEQAIEYQEVDFSFAAVYVDWLLERGHPRAEHLALKLHQERA